MRLCWDTKWLLRKDERNLRVSTIEGHQIDVLQCSPPCARFFLPPSLLNPTVALVCENLANNVLPTASDLAIAISPSLASKQPGSESFLAGLVAEASLAVMPQKMQDFNADSVRVVKVLGGGLEQSKVVRGMVFGREPEGGSRNPETELSLLTGTSLS